MFEIVPAGVIDATPPAGFAVAAVTPVVAVEVLADEADWAATGKSSLTAPAPPDSAMVWACPGSVTVTVWVWLITLENGVPAKSGTTAAFGVAEAGVPNFR